MASNAKETKFNLCGMVEKPLKAMDWILFAVIGFLCFFSFQQGDIFHTGGSSFAYLNGHILDFYDYNVAFVGGNAYLPSTYILFAIWNIPVYLLRLMTLPSISAPWIVVMWYKALPTLFYILSGFLLYKIGMTIGFDSKNSKLMSYIFLTSPLAFFSQFIFGQYDIFTVFFVLLGIYFYFKNDFIKFSILFGIAITFKYFALLIFIPLLLLREKNILKILKNAVIAAVPFVLEVLLYFRSPAFKNGVFGFGAKNYIFDAGFKTTATNISIVVVLWIAVAFWAFFTDVETKEDTLKWSLYFCNIVVFLIFGLSMWHPQWLIFAVPFMVMSSMINKKLDIFMLLDIVLMLFFTIFTVNFWINHVDQALMLNGIFKKIISSNLGVTVSMRSLFVIQDKDLIFSFITGLFLVNAIFKHPKYDIVECNPSIDKHLNIIRARFIIGVAIWVVPSLICWLACF